MSSSLWCDTCAVDCSLRLLKFSLHALLVWSNWVENLEDITLRPRQHCNRIASVKSWPVLPSADKCVRVQNPLLKFVLGNKHFWELRFNYDKNNVCTVSSTEDLFLSDMTPIEVSRILGIIPDCIECRMSAGMTSMYPLSRFPISISYTTLSTAWYPITLCNILSHTLDRNF